MRPGALALAIGLLAVPLSAQTAPDIAAYQAAIARDDLEEASRITDRLIDARRPADAILRTDSLLNALSGRLLVARGEIRGGRAYLERAAPSEVPEAIRAETLFSLATARELMGDWQSAAGTLNALASQRLDAEQARRLAYARARIALITDPAQASALVQPAIAAAPRAQDRWEGEFILGAARALLGDVGGGRAAADRAWVAAADAPAHHYAPYAAALLRAAVAPDRDRRIAMLNVARAAQHKISPWLANLLPLCEGAVTLADFVTFAVYRGSSNEFAYIPVRASRPAAVAAFHAPFAGRTLLESFLTTGGGSLVTVRCRSLISPAYDVAPPAIGPWEDWFAERGLYFSGSRGVSLEKINAVSSKLVALEERYGRNSPRLLPTIADLGIRLTARATQESDVDAALIRQLQSRTREIMLAAGAPASFFSTDSELATERAIAASQDPARAVAAMRKLTAAKIERMPLIVAYSDALNWFSNDSELPAAEKRTVVERLLARFADKPDDPRRRALLVRLAGIESKEDKRPAALRALAAAGAKPGSCPLLDETPTLLEQPITSDDYPDDLVRSDFEGHVVFEVSIDAKGRPSSPRLLMSSPGELFDEVTLSELAAFNFTPGERRGRAVGCTGYQSKVTWKLEDGEDELPAASEAEPVPSA